MRAKHKRTLTELFAKRAKLAADLYYDDKERGLALRVQASGHRSYYFVYNVRGRTRWYHIGWVNLSDARRIAAKLRLAVVEGRDPAAERQAERGAGTFAELYERYLEERAKRRNKSWRQADYLVRKHLLQRWGRLDARSITRADARAALGKIASPTVTNQTLAAASAIFKFGVKEEVLAFNPCKDIERHETRSRDRVLSDSELTTFWPHLSPALRMILLTGQRPGEVSHMRREHIRDGAWWEMPGAADPKTGWPGTKNGESHRIWLPEAAREIIATVTNVTVDRGFVFKRTHLDTVMRDICKRLGVEDKVTPHDLRRTFATRVAALGFGRQALSRILNHVDRSVTGSVYDRYAYAMEDQRVMERVAEHITSLVEGRRSTGAVIRGPFLNEAS